ncbi:unnamed protein product [Thelazia callipaeda]|uniref:Probable RNA-binding protein EIF1AD n=1 Tax=Thelazia callipaeda TaxID=103827 RepID=A0A0N5DAR4_THECL|nr:unnamed protein product [Thelazia callipaeda]
MSITTKKRFVMRQAESELFQPKGVEIVARVLKSPGRNLHEVEDENGAIYLVSMPRKFRETIYVKKDSFIFVIPIEEGVKVKGEITQILDKESVLYMREQKIWPARFEEYARSITREAKRGISSDAVRKHDVIDDDMLPPSDTDDNMDSEQDLCQESISNDELSSSEEDEENEQSESEKSSEDESGSGNLAFKVCNPNRMRPL